jgi:chloramphenicol-sensitive protein RarD
LALFAFGARRIAYSTVGVVQYIGPSLQLALGVFLFGEAFPPARAVGFGLIWAALVIYAGEGLWRASGGGARRADPTAARGGT